MNIRLVHSYFQMLRSLEQEVEHQFLDIYLVRGAVFGLRCFVNAKNVFHCQISFSHSVKKGKVEGEPILHDDVSSWPQLIYQYNTARLSIHGFVPRTVID